MLSHLIYTYIITLDFTYSGIALWANWKQNQVFKLFKNTLNLRFKGRKRENITLLLSVYIIGSDAENYSH